MPGGDPGLVAQLDAIAASHVPLVHEGHPGQIADVLAAVRYGRRPAITSQDGRAAIELITAIYESGTERRTVDLPLTSADPYYHTGELPKRAHHFYEKENSVEDQGGFIVVEGSPDPAQR